MACETCTRSDQKKRWKAFLPLFPSPQRGNQSKESNKQKNVFCSSEKWSHGVNVRDDVGRDCVSFPDISSNSYLNGRMKQIVIHYSKSH
jgi:hypothetical protein